jgi:hypothetical protein
LAALDQFAHSNDTTELCMVLFCLDRMTDTDREVTDQEDREAEALERRWRRGSVAMLVTFLVILGVFCAGIYLLTHW